MPQREDESQDPRARPAEGPLPRRQKSGIRLGQVRVHGQEKAEGSVGVDAFAERVRKLIETMAATLQFRSCVIPKWEYTKRPELTSPGRLLGIGRVPSGRFPR
jgi:hypothetical protein